MDRIAAIEVGAASDTGRQRESNEDQWAGPPADLAAELLARKGSLWIVADGMGGHQAGELASALAVQTVVRTYYANPSDDPAASLIEAVLAANAEILRQAQDPALPRMGTTVVAAVVHGERLTVAHVGDSRAYLLHRGHLRVLTQDHTWVAEQVRTGLLTVEQAERHVARHALSRSVGHRPDLAVDVSHAALHRGDRVLLCSDGVWEQVPAADLQATLKLSPQRAAQRLVELANAAGGRDNATVLVIDPSPGAAGVRPVPLPWLLAGIAAVVLIAALAALGGGRLEALLARATHSPTPAGVLEGDLVTLTPAPTGSPLPVTPTPTPEPAAAATSTPKPSPSPGPEPLRAEVAASDGLNVRPEPSTSVKEDATLPYEEEVWVECRRKGTVNPAVWWYYVRYRDDRHGYASAKWIELDGGRTVDDVRECAPADLARLDLQGCLVRAGAVLCSLRAADACGPAGLRLCSARDGCDPCGGSAALPRAGLALP